MRRLQLADRIAITMITGVSVFLVALVFSIDSIRKGANDQSLNSNIKAMAQKIEALREPVRLFAKDYNNWDEAYKATLSQNIPYIADNYAITAIYGEIFDGVVIFDGPFKNPISWTKGSSRIPSQSFLPQEALSAVRAATADQVPGKRATFDFVSLVNGAIAIHSASTMFPESLDLFSTFDQNHRTIAVLRKTLSPTDLKRIEKELEISELKFSPKVGDGASLPILGLSNEVIGYFTWDSPRSGDHLLQNLLPLLAVVLAAFLIVAGLGTHAMYFRARSLTVGEANAAKLARTDSLTSLPNRLAFLEHMAKAADYSPETVALLAIDLNGFKRVNDLMGHVAGDRILQEFAKRLRCLEGPEAFLARLGGDEFIAAISSTRDLSAAITLVEQGIIKILRAPFAFKGHSFQLTASLGLAVKESLSLTSTDLMRRADQAMYLAKEANQSELLRYDDVLDATCCATREIEAALVVALERVDEFYISYQPIVDSKSHKLVSAEALARWNSRTLGSIPPSLFISVAEKCGLITKLGWILIDKIIADLLVYPKLRVSVNVSPIQLLSPRFAAELVARLAKSSIEADRMEIELTEGIVMHSADRVAGCLSDLRGAGFSIALDDFGTGFSSIGYIHKMPFTALKIDKSFVSGGSAAAANAKLVSSMIVLGHSVGKIVVGEGVETARQAKDLQKKGCDRLQGYFFGSPDSVAALFDRYSDIALDCPLKLSPDQVRLTA